MYNFLAPHVCRNTSTNLDLFQEMMIFLMKINLDNKLSESAVRFNISDSVTRKIFNTWLNVISTNLRELILWPHREALQATMPAFFRKRYGTSAVVMLDCIEIILDTYFLITSNGNQHKCQRTVKYLIGMAPQGSITFVSRSFGVQLSDHFIVENSGILDLIIPGDTVLADETFKIAKAISQRGADLQIPEFIECRRPDSQRKKPNLRLSIKTVIGLFQEKFRILSGIRKSKLIECQNQNVCPLDKMVTVCAVLWNLNDSITICS